jgi:hydrogenase nickel incorporation protein HypB
MTAKVIAVEREALAASRLAAAEFRRQMTEAGTLVVNLVSSPGAGKTSLLIETAKQFKGRRSLAVLVGDIATLRDAERIAPFAPVVQLTTGGACHLDLSLVERGWNRLEQQRYDFLFIENVGNLVCPASHELGEHLRVVLLSTPEGDDKPGKYPKMFRTSQALILTKTDLLPYLPFSLERAVADAHAIQPRLKAIATSTINGDGIDEWCEFLDISRCTALGNRLSPAPRQRPLP